MDNFTHSLAGWALGQTGLKSKTRKGLAALILGANMPDIDVFFGWVPWAPLATHRGFTHGLIGALVILPVLLAGLLWALDRWQCRRSAEFRSGLAMDVRWLFALCFMGALTHPLLDLQTSYSVQLLSPFSTRWFHTETLFIIDVVLWTVLPLAIWLSRRRERQGRSWRRSAIWGLIVAGLYIAGNGAISLAARQALVVHLGRVPEISYAGQEPIRFWMRSLVWREQGRIGYAHYDPLHSVIALYDIRPPVSDGMRDPLARRAIAMTPSLTPFLRWSTMPVAVIRKQGCTASVAFADARYLTMVPESGPLPSGRPFSAQPVLLPLGGPGCGSTLRQGL